jgi:mono/diheme cytochrome c family protein
MTHQKKGRPMKSAVAAAILVAGLALAGASPALADNAASIAQVSAYPDLTTGEALYKGICQGCHMPDAKGAQGAAAYPSLAASQKLKIGAYPMLVVTRGQKAMPEFGSSFTDAQIANVVNYIRTSFGNGYKDAVTEADVAKLRPPPAK